MLMGLSDTTTTTADAAPAWYDIAGQFQARYAEFNAVYAGLQAQSDAVTGMPAELQIEYQQLMDQAATIKSTADGAMASVNSALTYLKSVFGLGFIQLVPIAVIGASLAAVTYWLSNAYVTAKKLDTFNAAVASGVNPTTALQTITAQSGLGSFTSAIGGALGWAVVIGVAIFILPRLWKK